MQTIAELEVGKSDGLGEAVKLIYGRNPPHYAVFGTEQRVLVQFADAPAQANEQRKAFAVLNPIRGEINGLIDGWRTKTVGRRDKAESFDRRVGDALIVAFEGDIEGARALLDKIKADILADRTALARLQYVAAAAGCVLVAALIGAVAHRPEILPRLGLEGEAGALFEPSGAGGLGAFFSIALGVRDRTVLPDLQALANTMDAALRVLIGVIAASMLVALLIAKVARLGLGDGDVTSTSWLLIFIVGFLGGFSERLVPDLLGKVASNVDLPPPAKPAGPPQPGDGAKAGDPPPAQDVKPAPKPADKAKDGPTAPVGLMPKPAAPVTGAEMPVEPPAGGGSG